MGTWIIDADTHLLEAPDLWTSRVPRRHADHVPRVVRDEDEGRDYWVLDGAKLTNVGGFATAGWPGFPADVPPSLDDCIPAAYDAQARLAYMDGESIWAEVLYPNVAGFGNQRFRFIQDEQLQLLCVSAYNDFLHEWAAADPERLITVCSTPFWDIDATVAEVERCAERGFRGVLFTGEPQRFGLPILGNRHWDPLWSVAQDAGLPIHFHVGGGEVTRNRHDTLAQRNAEVGRAGTAVYATNELYLKNGLQCADLLGSGILQRFPELKFVSVESGIGWLPFVLETADYSYLGMSQVGRVRTGSELLPSELFARQVYCTYWFEQIAPTHLLDVIPVDNVMFETDFPHPACLYGNVEETIDRGLVNASDEVRHKILWDNAARLYGIAAPVLS